MKKFITLMMSVALLFSTVTVSAAEVPKTAKQNADYMMKTNEDGVPNWFNGEYYSDKYEDLKEAFGNNEKALYKHSLQFGFDEARLVTPVLDVVKYRECYPDLDKAFGDNWKLYVRHYFEFGINEGRENFTDFDAETYLSMYSDLQDAFGDDLVSATRHYMEYGLSEGRSYNQPEPENIYVYIYAGSFDVTGDNIVEKRVDNEDGSYQIITYKDGVLVSSQTKNANGSLISESTYYETGIIKTKTNYNADGKKSTYIEYDEQGYETLTIWYQEDSITELARAIYIYDENGNLISEETTYADGIFNKNTYENGVRAYQVTIQPDGTRAEAEYYPDGQTIKKSTEFLSGGTKYVVERWENSNFKTCTWYDASGNITRQQLYAEDGSLTSDDVYAPVNPDTPTEG